MGKSPETVFVAATGSTVDELDEDKLRRAFTVRERRRVRHSKDACDAKSTVTSAPLRGGA